MDKLDKLLDRYQEHFEENFPLMLCRTMQDDEIIQINEDCFEKDEPYAPDLKAEANY